MVASALGSALSPSIWVLIAFRFLLGFGVGGDYPVSAVLMSEYANRKDRGKLVGMVFGTQALGLIVGPLIALALLGAGVGDGVASRTILTFGAVPAAAVIYLRRRMPESPRYQVQVQGQAEEAASQLSQFTRGQVNGNGSGGQRDQMGLRAFLTNRRYLILLAGTAGTWFLLDYAYYGNTISTPQILGLISPGASTMTKIALQLAIFVVAAVPGYVLAIARLDRYRARFLAGEVRDLRYGPLERLLRETEKLACPTLMVQGGSDFCDEPRASEGMERFFTGSYRRVVLNGIGHFPTAKPRSTWPKR